ncbi:cyanamide hydratase [Sparganum proliferum]
MDKKRKSTKGNMESPAEDQPQTVQADPLENIKPSDKTWPQNEDSVHYAELVHESTYAPRQMLNPILRQRSSIGQRSASSSPKLYVPLKPADRLYLRCTILGHPVLAIVNTSCSRTLMSLACARRCNLEDSMDRSLKASPRDSEEEYALGQIHACNLNIRQILLSISPMVVSDGTHDLVLGLNTLREHQCCVDLANNQLVIGNSARVDFMGTPEPPPVKPKPYRANLPPEFSPFTAQQEEKIREILRQELPRHCPSPIPVRHYSAAPRPNGHFY